MVPREVSLYHVHIVQRRLRIKTKQDATLSGRGGAANSCFQQSLFQFIFLMAVLLKWKGSCCTMSENDFVYIFVWGYFYLWRGWGCAIVWCYTSQKQKPIETGYFCAKETWKDKAIFCSLPLVNIHEWDILQWLPPQIYINYAHSVLFHITIWVFFLPLTDLYSSTKLSFTIVWIFFVMLNLYLWVRNCNKSSLQFEQNETKSPGNIAKTRWRGVYCEI